MLLTVRNLFVAMDPWDVVNKEFYSMLQCVELDSDSREH